MATSEPSITVYSASWCGKCARLKILLRSAGITWREIDIEDLARRPAAGAEGTHRRMVAPTVEFGDGTLLTNPTVKQVQDKLRT